MKLFSMRSIRNWRVFLLKLVATLARAWGLRRLLQRTHALGERGYVRGRVLKQSLVFLVALTGLMVCTTSWANDLQDRITNAIAIHGGAGTSPDRLTESDRQAYAKSLKRVLTVGKGILENGGTSLDAVEQVIRILEDDPLFNAGKGAVFNRVGGHGPNDSHQSRDQIAKCRTSSMR